MADYQKFINALRKCAKEHENDRTSTGHIIVSDLCRDTANLLEALEEEPMQVELEGDGYSDGKLVYDYGKCPKCGREFEYGDKDWEEPYCCHCGQKLHWFESEG